MKLLNIKNLLFIFFCLFAIDAMGQQSDTIEIQRNEKGKIEFARFKPNANRKMQDGTAFLKNILQAKPDDELRLLIENKDEIGITHHRYQQYYKGIKVENAEYIIHGKNDYIETINGKFADIKISSVIPKIDSTIALNNALKVINAKKYSWQNINNPIYPKANLVISRDSLQKDIWHLAWKFTILASEPLLAENIFIDAETGEVINRYSIICNTNTPGTADTRYSGTQSITGDSFIGGFRLREVQNNVNIQTLNYLHSGDANNTSLAVDFVDNDNNWTSSEWNNANKDNAALDAHWGAENVLAYWQTVRGRNSIDGNGLAIRSYPHFSSNYNNAFWYPPTLSMYYGDGDGSLFKPLTSLDVCAHELGHGVCQFTANLVYQGESGALNEGLSDIWGATIEAWAAPNKQRWLIGEDIMVSQAALRSMNNPKQFNQPDTYHGTNWASTSGGDNGGVHTNSGVINHWYYLLSDGGSGSNDLGNGFNVTGIGMTDAASIAYRAELVYLISSADYAAARNATISATRDLFGINSCQEISVTNAWYAVGVGGQYTSPTTPLITGADAICYNSSAVYTISNVPVGTVITWSPSDANRTVVPSADRLSATVTNLSTSSTATSIMVSIPGCNGQVSSTKFIALGAPYITGSYTNAFDGSNNPLGYYPYITNPACTGYYINTNMDITGANSVTWSKINSNGVVNFTQNSNDISFYLFFNGEYALFQLDASNGCGTTTNQFKWLASNCSTNPGGCNAFSISPNPASGNVNAYVPSILPPCLTSNGFTTPPNNNLLIKEVRIYDNLKHLKKVINAVNSKKVSINISNLTSGVYFVEILGNNNYKETQTIIVQ